MSKVSSVDNRYSQIDRRFNDLQTGRKIVYGTGKAMIIGAGALAAKSIAKNENSLLTKYISKGVDFAAGALKKGLTTINKKGFADKAIKGLNKAIGASAKTKALAVAGTVVTALFVNNIRNNNRTKGIIAQAQVDSKILQDSQRRYEEVIIPRAIREAQKDTREKIAFGE